MKYMYLRYVVRRGYRRKQITHPFQSVTKPEFEGFVRKVKGGKREKADTPKGCAAQSEDNI